MITPQFLNISNESAMPLDALAPQGDDTSDNVEIQTLDAAGKTVSSYYWNDYMYDDPCWVDGDYEKVESVTFAPGQGLWVFGSATEQSLQAAGKVGTADVTVQLRFGATPTGVPFPTSVALQDILPQGDDTSDNVEIQTLDAAGKTIASYYWNDYMYDDPCWVDGDYEKVEDVSFAAGQGLWIFGSSTDQSIVFPAPEL